MIWRSIMTRVTPKLQAVNNFPIGDNKIKRTKSFRRHQPSNNHQNHHPHHHHRHQLQSESHPNNLDVNKKVQFGPATISYQVKYVDLTNEESFSKQQQSILNKKRIMMYPKTRIEMIRWLLKQVTIKQWIKFVIFFILILTCLWQIISLYRIYRKKHVQTSITYDLPEEIEFPSLTLCLPIIIPFNHRCMEMAISSTVDQTNESSHIDQSTHCSNTPLSSIFNQSMSEYGHQCRIKIKSLNQVIHCANISPPIESFYQNRKCYTYLSEISVFRSNADLINSLPISDTEDVSVNLIIQSSRFRPTQGNKENPLTLYLHQIDQIPIDLVKEPLNLSIGRQYHLQYYFMKTKKLDQEFSDCRNYSGQHEPKFSQIKLLQQRRDLRLMLSREECFNRCFMEEWRSQCGTCFPTSVIIRRDLIEAQDTFCSPEDDSDQPSLSIDDRCHQNQEQMIEKIQLEKCQTNCPGDCTMVDVQHQIDVSSNEDSTETLVTIKRKIQPDQIITQSPSMSKLQLLSYIGGLLMFWLAIAWIISKIIDFISFGYDVYQLNCV